MQASPVRSDIRRATGLQGSPLGVNVPVSNARRAYILARLERLHTLLNQLDKATIVAGKPVRTRMRRELTAAKKAVRSLLTDRAR